MARAALLRQLAAAAGLSGSCSCPPALLAPTSFATLRGYATEGYTRKDVIYHLSDPDPEAVAAIKAFQREQFALAAKGSAAGAATEEPKLDLTARIERKYVTAEIIESGIQGVHVPLGASSAAPLKRYISQLQRVGAAAGLGAPSAELDAKLADAAATSISVKDLLAKAAPYSSPEFHSALLNALAEVEGELGGVTLDPTSPAYKKFAEKVKALAQGKKLPWQMLVSHRTRLAGADEDTRDGLAKDFAAWVQSAQLADVNSELGDLAAQAQALLDTHLSKSAEATRKEQEAQHAALLRKLEAAKGTKWADQFAKDLAYVSWFDAQVARDPAKGPSPAA